MKSYWETVAANIVPWNELVDKQISKVELREQYIITQAIIIQAFGQLGRYFYINRDVDMECVLKKLSDVDWSRTADIWLGRVIRQNGKIINSNDAARLSCNVMKNALGIALDAEDQKYEDSFKEVK